MVHERQILEWKPAELKDADRFFERLTNTDPRDPDPKYGTSIADARELMSESTLVRGVLRRVTIESRDAESVTLEGGLKLTGAMPVKALEKADDLYAFVITLDGFDKVGSDDIMTEYFADTWGSAFVECAQSMAGDFVSSALSGEGMIRTHMWCPGQHTFDLKNQKTLFELLDPQDIGCTLTGRMMMVPVKSASGIMGVVPQGTKDMPKPCDYCSYRKSCPASMNGCAAL